MPFELRLTDAGRAALADGTNRGTQAVRLTKMAVGDGSGPGGAADDSRTALRSQRAVVALGGSTMVSGRIAVRGEFNPAAAYGVTELGLLGQVGTDPEFLAAYWTDDGERLASTVANTRLVIAGSLDIAPAAAEVTVNVDAAVSLGDPALSASVTALGGRVDTAEADIDALEAAGFGALITALAARVEAIETADFAGQITALEDRSVIRSIQRGGVVLPTSGGPEVTHDIAISAVDTAKTVVHLDTTVSAGGNTLRTFALFLASATVLRFQYTATSLLTGKNFRYEVIEFE
ncbi:MAG: phage tail protein [Bryobacterales bacterium]|nr:phage tail protein [Bryobacterales bacterium]